MATAALLNLAPSDRYFPSSTAAAFCCTNAINMHVTRPKSAKGRTRSSFSYSHRVEACPCRVPSSPPPAAARESGNSQRTSSTKPVFPSGQVSPEEIPELLQQVPLRTSSSLNKYRVLPSIGRKGLENSAVEIVTEQTNRLKMSRGQEEAQKIKPLSREQGSTSIVSETEEPTEEGSQAQCPPSEKPGRKMRQESSLSSTLSLEEPSEKEPDLLLAIRSPSGQRFEHHFKPTDSLQTVLAVAEQKTTTKYKRCSVETMEVPRRSFSDLTRSLQECGILHKSVLCILQNEQQEADLSGYENCSTNPIAPL
ncbi:UBX domain-containing protein 10 [Apteryx rowi]|uniref:UBX domain-containing protein 10 n=1 Tax=Apteryx rowi TaxID=308060 RepID=UPI000E1CB00A|nr:UBX domain-containing protein 10 [Apteryx rowi]